VRPAELERFLERRIVALTAVDDATGDMEAQLGAAARIWLELRKCCPLNAADAQGMSAAGT